MVSSVPSPPSSSAQEPASKRRRIDKKSHSRSSSPYTRQTAATITSNDDFISFADDPVLPAHLPKRPETDHKGKSRAPEKGRYERERDWDRGKKRQRSRSRSRDRYDDRDRREHDRPRRNREYNYVNDPAEYAANQRHQIAQQAPWVSGLDLASCQDAAELLHTEIKAFDAWISPTPAEDEVRSMIVLVIAKIIKDKFPDAEVRPFGSYGTKLYLPHGDIDLVVQSNTLEQNNKKTVLQRLADLIRSARLSSGKVQVIGARVPIIKFVTSAEYGRFQIDISINQFSGIVSSDIINGFQRGMQCPTAIRALVLILKLYLSQRQMNEVYTGGLGSYSIVCLVVSFLQMHPKIRNGEIDPEKNLGVLLLEFLELYGKYHNYEEVGISLRHGGQYFSKRIRGWFNYNKPRALSVEDPCDPENDVSSGSYNYFKVRQTMAGAHDILTSAAFVKTSMLNAQHNRTYASLRHGETHAADFSMLSSIVHIPQDIINHRRLVQEIYDDGRLHQLLGLAPPIVPSADTDLKQSTAAPPSTAPMNPPPPPPSSSSRARAVENTWRTADTDVSDPEVVEVERHSKRRHADDEDEDEGGRYGIGSKKKRGGSKAKTVAAIYVSDDEDSDGPLPHERSRNGKHGADVVINVDDSGYAEELQPPRPRSRRPSVERQSSRAKTERKRAYWSSLAAESGNVDEEDV
ncbi:hypothetical protein BD626DRAFT_409309 [Schizophyllum amplum]|uniref:polynucleotide adenylyltransferase n=1 Tax=Schizophyllum amplum TaxID=97359 RepID=A0A550C336_9AGAR|nr:hypothetical protein BD626DRAFT_409309 [Auriculariopsis ampla]